MKKMMLVLLTLVVSLSFITNISALANETILDYATRTHYIAGNSVKLSNSDVLKIERFLNQYEVSNTEANEIISKMEQIKTILNNEGTIDFTKLSKAKKDEILNIASSAANVIGATITYDNTDKTLFIYKDGNKIEAISLNPYLKQTGNSNIVYVALTGAVIAVSSLIIYRKSRNA